MTVPPSLMNLLRSVCDKLSKVWRVICLGFGIEFAPAGAPDPWPPTGLAKKGLASRKLSINSLAGLPVNGAQNPPDYGEYRHL